MDFNNLPNGNGQEIYVEPDELDIKPEWINEELCAIIMPEIPIQESNPVYEAYRNLFKCLYEKGYKIVTDSRKANNNTFFFSPCLDKHINKTRVDYQKKRNRKIDFCLSNEKMGKPISVIFPENFFPDNLPPLPLILKNEDSHGGIEKFLIKTPEQLEILKKFYNEINPYFREYQIEQVKKQWSFFKDLEFDENGHSNHGISISIVDYKKVFHENMVIQEFIKTPTKYNTSLRVLVSSSGDILCASLKYSETSKEKNKTFYGLFDTFLSAPSSPYFLGEESIVSNTVAGGNSILLGKDSYSNLEREILIAHGIDPDNFVVPYSVMNACINIAVNCNREIGAISGMDFIYDENDKSWKYLEEHEFPMLSSYAEKYNIIYDPNSKDFYPTHHLLDLDARVKSLILTMYKKQTLEFESEEKRYV